MKELDDHTTLARREYEHGRYRLAVQFAEYAIARDPENAVALRVLGQALVQRREIAGGIDALERSSLLRPLGWDAHIDLACAYGTLGKRKLSRDLLMQAGISERLNATQLLRVAAGLASADEPSLAMEACRLAGVKSPDFAEVHYQMGYYALGCGYPVSVTESLIRHAVGLEPNNIHYRLGLASLLSRIGRNVEAAEVVSSWLPDGLAAITCGSCLKRIANLFFDLGDEIRARQAAARLHELRQPVPGLPRTVDQHLPVSSDRREPTHG